MDKVIVIGEGVPRGRKVAFRGKRQKKDGSYHAVQVLFPEGQEPNTPCVVEAAGKIHKPENSFQIAFYVSHYEHVEVTYLEDKEITYLGSHWLLTKRQAEKMVEAYGVQGVMSPTLEEIAAVAGDRAVQKITQNQGGLASRMAKVLNRSPGFIKMFLQQKRTLTVADDPYLIVSEGLGTVKQVDYLVEQCGLKVGLKYKHICQAVRDSYENSGSYILPYSEFLRHCRKVFGYTPGQREIKRLQEGFAVSGPNWAHKESLKNVRYINTWIQLAETRPRVRDIQLADWFTPEQKGAILGALSHRISCITGSAGSGKSSTLLGLLDAMDELGLTYHLMAPSGKAANRIREVTGREASTVHSLLARTEHEIEGDYMVVDESSMLCGNILAQAIQANPNANWCFVGDDAQLPPIGIGQAFNEMLDKVPTFRLTTIHRQAEGSPILKLASHIREAARGHCKAVEELQTEDDTQALALIKKRFMGGWQLLTPYRAKSLGSQELCKLWTEKNQEAEEKFNGPWNTFCIGDKVIHKLNTYNGIHSVFNGEIGIVTKITKKEMTVDYGRMQHVYTSYTAKDLDHAYAVTVHASQGSEFDRVCLVLPKRPYNKTFLTKELLYTAVTRAKKELVVVGDVNALYPSSYPRSSHQKVLK